MNDTDEPISIADTDVAILGMACRFPGAGGPEAFWRNLCAGVESIARFSPDELRAAGVAESLLADPRHVPAAGLLESPELFEPELFGFTAREAEITDPQQRIFLEVAWEALESAGYVPETVPGPVGVFAGAAMSAYLRLVQARPELTARMGGFRIRLANDKDFLPTWTSYKLDLKGPSVGIQTACSTALVALHLACQSLLGGECDLALAGGVSIALLGKTGYLYHEGGILSPDGHCRPFDAAAAGTVGGCGAGVVLLRPLRDALAAGDPVLAVIRGSAINNDGALKVGFTAPSVDGQARAIAEALAVARVEPQTLGYVEAHGTGTALGDPVEVTALAEALGRRARPCPIGSVKGNVGHLDTAAGVAGLIKTILALRHRQLPPSLHFERPNPKVDLAAAGLRVVAALEPWPSDEGPRRAGVSAFGIGGTNAHVILEEAPPVTTAPSARGHHLLVLSARTAASLERGASALAAHLREQPELEPGGLADVAHTLQVGRRVFAHRRAVVAASAAEAAAALAEPRGPRPSAPGAGAPAVAFLFPGQGAQHPGMAAGLYRSEPVFRAAVDRCAERLSPFGIDPRVDLDARRLNQTEVAQPMLFTVSWALAQLWLDWGVRPVALLGHSIGEFVAACLAGVFSVDDALEVVAQRGRLMQELPPGEMLAVPLSEAEVAPLLGAELALAAVNAPARCVVAGPPAAIAACADTLAACGVESRRLATSHAFHSAMVEPIQERFAAVLARVELRPPAAELPFVSNLSGTWIRAQEATDPGYWVRHLRSTVRFSAGVGELLATAPPAGRVLLELGPGRALSGLVRQHPSFGETCHALSSLPAAQRDPRPDEHAALEALGAVWSLGVEVDLARLYADERRRRVPLPTYSFERERYWVEAPLAAKEIAMPEVPPEPAAPEPAAPEPAAPAAPATSQPPTRREAILEVLGGIVRELTGMRRGRLDPTVEFAEVGVDSLLLIQAAQLIEDRLGVRVSIVQLLEELTNLDRLTGYLDHVLPAGQNPPLVAEILARRAAPPEPAVPVVPAPTPAAVPLAVPATGGSLLEQILLQQTQLMSQMVAMMQAAGGQPIPAVLPPAPVAVAPPPPAPEPPPVAAGPQRLRVQSDVYVPYTPADRRQEELTPEQRAHLDALIARHGARTRGSKEHVQRYRSVLADGRMSARFRRLFKELIYPIVGARSAGSRLWDVDGNEYVDFGMGFGLHLLGHSPPFLVQAMAERLAAGIELGPHSNLAGEVAAQVCRATGFDRATFCNSGTEAVMVSLRMARSFTRRPKIAFFAGGYHGWSDLTQARAIVRDGKRVSVAMAPGVSPGAIEDILVLDFESPAALEAIRRHAHELAAVLVEPVQSRRPEAQAPEFLHELRKVTAEHGVVLICDEMVTGFRVGPAGAQGWLGLRGDLAIYGKVLAGGLPLGAVAGKAELMDMIDGGPWRFGDDSYPPAERTIFSGAYFKHPLTMATAHAILGHLEAGGQALYDDLNARTARLAAKVNAFLDAHEVPMQIGHFGSLFRLQFSSKLPHASLIYYQMIDKGAFLIPEVGNCFLSTAHDDAEVDFFVAAVEQSVGEMVAAGLLPGRAPAIRPDGYRPPIPARSSAARAKIAARPVEEPVEVSGEAAETPARMRFSLYYFGAYDAAFRADKYDLLVEGVRFADRRGFHAVWLPERHFHPFGGFSPNPSVLASALARETQRLQLRAGSVVLPLHHPIRVAEEWAVVDNLSRGRIGVSFASGWHPNDFAFAPGAFDDRHELLVAGIETVRRLWSGEALETPDGNGKPMKVRLFPMPMQRELPIWLTGSSERTFELAGRLGAGVVTNLQAQTVEELEAKIARYRRERAERGHDPKTGRVCVLVHTYLDADRERAIEEARQPLYGYMRSNLHLLGNFLNSHDRKADLTRLPERDLDYLLARAYERWIDHTALLGTPESCAPVVERLAEIGVDEVGCLIDFGLDPARVLAGLEHLDVLRRSFIERVPEPIAERRIAERRVALNPGQQAIWFLTQLGPAASAAYNEAMTFELRGALAPAALQHAVERVVARHEALRGRCPDGEVLMIDPPRPVPLPLIDLARLPEPHRRAEAERRLAAEALGALDLERGPMLRTRLFRLAADHHHFSFTTHHLVLDGHASTVVTGELAAFYTAAVGGRPPRLAAPVALDGVRQPVPTPAGDTEAAAGEAYWQRAFARGLPTLELPTDRPRPRLKSFRVTRCWRPLGEELSARLRAAGKRSGTTVFMSLLAGFSALLAQLCDQEDVIVGINAADLLPADQRALVSYRVNAIALPLQVRATASFAEHLLAIKKAVAEGWQHQRAFSPRQWVQKLARRPDPRRPLVPVLLDIERAGQPPRFGDLAVEVGSLPGGAKLDLYLNVVERPDQLLLRCDGDADLFDHATLERWMDHLALLLDAATGAPERPLAELPRLPKRLPERLPEPVLSAEADAVPGSNMTRYQQLLWMGEKLHPGNPMFVLAAQGRIPCAVDPAVMRRAVAALLAEGDALRTVVAEQDGVPVQRVLERLELEVPLIDVGRLADPRAEARRVARRLHRTPMTLARRLFDVALFRLAAAEHEILLRFHHLVADAITCNLAGQRLCDLYAEALAGEPVPAARPSFAEIAAREPQRLASARALKARDYWSRKLAQPLEPLAPYGCERAAGDTRVERVTLELGESARLAFEAAATRAPLDEVPREMALYNALAAVVLGYLYRVSGNRRIAIGAPYHGRATKPVRETFGLLMQIMPLQLVIAPSETFVSLAGKVGEEMLVAFRNRDYPVGNAGQRPAYEVEVNYYAAADQRFLGELSRVEWLHPGHGGEILAVQAEHRTTTGTLSLHLDWHRGVFDDALRARAIRHFERVLAGFCAAPGQAVDAVELLDESERRQILGELASGPRRTWPPGSLLERFAAQVAADPVRASAGRTAVAAGGAGLDYAELDRRSDRIAHALGRRGVGRDDVVALLAPRGLDLLTGILGVFKAGAAYLPLDPSYPAQRIEQIRARSQCRALLTMDELAELAGRETGSMRGPAIVPTQLAYVIYTSGSTGQPKGAMLTHEGMLNHLQIKIDDLDLGPEDVVAQTASQCFDISVWQFLAALVVGGRVEVIDDDVTRDPLRLLAEVERRGVTVLEVVPSLLRAALDELETAGAPRPALAGLRWLLVTGEALPGELCRRWLALYPGIPMVNAFGPTECSDDVTHHLIRAAQPAGTRVPIGRPLANLRVDVLDTRLEPVPQGVVGEVFVAGIGVGRGYLHDPARTAAVFIPDPWAEAPGGRLYKTGDRGRWDGAGALDFLGRVDHQVKIRGLRIEPEEIAAVLESHPALRQAVVVVRDDGPAEHTLAAYVVALDAAPAVEELRGFLGARLPDYMVPASFTVLAAMPLGPTGKLDRKALPRPAESDRGGAEQVYVAPRGAVEQTLATIWAQVLGVARVGIHDDFFDLGGDSILSIHIVSRANRAGLHLAATDLFRHTTIARLADFLATSGERPAALAEQGPVVGAALLTPIQRWFFELALEHPHHWNQALLLEIPTPLDTRVLRAALAHVLAHHDALRTRFWRDDEGWRAEVRAPGAAAQVLDLDLSALAPARRRAAITAAATAVQASLDLDGTLLRAARFRLAEGQSERLLLVAHHLVVDAVSWRILLDDLLAAYRQLAAGGAVALPAKTTSFASWARLLTERVASAPLQQERRRWLELPWERVRPLPVDVSGGADRLGSSRRVVVALDPEPTGRLLRDVPKEHGVRIQELLLAALAAAVRGWTGESVVLVDLEGHGREEPSAEVDLSRTVGWFTVIQPAVVDLEGCADAHAVLARARDSLRRFPHGGMGFGVLRAMTDDGRGDTALAALPRAEIAFNYLGQVDQIAPGEAGWKIARESAGPVANRRERRPRLLEITAVVAGGRLQAEWGYSGEVHHEPTVRALAESFLAVLRGFAEGAETIPAQPDFADLGWSAEEAAAIAAVIGASGEGDR